MPGHVDTRNSSVLLASGMPGLQTSVGGVLLAVALLASYLPARRAARINPVDALRSE